jgi:hypothetical protein
MSVACADGAQGGKPGRRGRFLNVADANQAHADERQGVPFDSHRTSSAARRQAKSCSPSVRIPDGNLLGLMSDRPLTA